MPVNDPSDPTTREALLHLELYNGVTFFFDTDTVLKTSVAGVPISLISPYSLVRARFDCAAGATLVRAQFTCAVTDEADSLGGHVSPSQRPACVVTLAPAP